MRTCESASAGSESRNATVAVRKKEAFARNLGRDIGPPGTLNGLEHYFGNFVVFSVSRDWNWGARLAGELTSEKSVPDGHPSGTRLFLADSLGGIGIRRELVKNSEELRRLADKQAHLREEIHHTSCNAFCLRWAHD